MLLRGSRHARAATAETGASKLLLLLLLRSPAVLRPRKGRRMAASWRRRSLLAPAVILRTWRP